jgi:hypothetical protein
MPKYLLVMLAPWAFHPAVMAQSGSSGTLRGVVVDASDLPLAGAAVAIGNRESGFPRKQQTGSGGEFSWSGLPFSTYRVSVSMQGFAPRTEEISVRTSAPLEIRLRLDVAGHETSMTVNGNAEGYPETQPSPVHSGDRRLLAGLPALSPDSGLNDAILYTTPGVAADSNGFFHPLGDHAQVSYVIDGQPVSDQRNKVFSTSIPANAIQSMEVISGSPAAEYGDKTSLVIHATTRSGLGQKPSGSFMTSYGSFGTVGEESSFAAGTPRVGSFLVFNAERTGRFLDTPEFRPVHDTGNTGTLFHRLDFQPNGKDTWHLNAMAARNWLQVPNTYDQSAQDQKQKVVSFNIAPGFQHTFDAHSLLSINAFVRRDAVRFYASRNPLDDSPATLAQARSLRNAGVRADVSGARGRHNWKAGLQASQTYLDEEFRLGITRADYNSPCLHNFDSAVKDPLQCQARGDRANPDFLGGLLPYDLTRGGRLYEFHADANIRQMALFVQDTLTVGALTVSTGVRLDRYRGLADGQGWQPRGAFSWLVKRTGTVIRGGYTHTLETPTNENLVVSSSTGPGGLAGSLLKGSAEQHPIALGSRNQYDAGVQQRLGKWVLVDASYFRKYTRNAFDFDALFSTPVTVPIGWRQSKLDGISARISSAEVRGWRIYATMGHANARFFGPETGGIVFNSNLSVGAYRQDHDQVYQQNVNVHYQPGRAGWWADFTWRYDSGLVVGAVNNLQDALDLTADQQAVIGFYCGAEKASLTHRVTACGLPVYGASRIHILGPGAENDDRNPPRATPRHVFSLGVGTGDLLHSEHVKTAVRFTVLNLANEAALYNFLSPFSGTHWVAPRMYQAQLGWTF